MKRSPVPGNSFNLDRNFRHHFAKALSINDAVHDGAVAFGRRTSVDPYTCAGWSFLISPSFTAPSAEQNRGAAYNSAIALSSSTGVDCVALFTAADLTIFRGGQRLEF
jgi:hypothetical protein